MSWLFSQALVEEFSVGTSLAGEPYAQLNVMPTPHKFWRNDKTMESSDLSRFGLTLRLLTESHGKELLTWFREDFLAKILVQQGREQELKVSEADYGNIWPASFAKYSQDMHSLKTVQCSLIEDSTQSSVTLPKWGSMRNGELSEQMTLEHYIGAKEYGSLLPTPSGCQSGKNHVCGRLDEWGGSSNPWRKTEIGKVSSPAFEEWIMDWPVQWTELTAYEMDKFQQWQQQHGGF